MVCGGVQLLRKKAIEIQATTKAEEGGAMYGRTLNMPTARSDASSASATSRGVTTTAGAPSTGRGLTARDGDDTDGGGGVSDDSGDDAGGDEDDPTKRALKAAQREAKRKAKEAGVVPNTVLQESGARIDPEQAVIVRQRQMKQEALLHELRRVRRKGAG